MTKFGVCFLNSVGTSSALEKNPLLNWHVSVMSDLVAVLHFSFNIYAYCVEYVLSLLRVQQRTVLFCFSSKLQANYWTRA